MGFTEQEFEQLKRNQVAGQESPSQWRERVLGSKKRQPNKWEEQFSAMLTIWRETGLIRWFKFEGMRFRLADGAYYKPDFVALLDTGGLVAYEVKGHWREAARLRIKVAADQHPIVFFAVTKAKNGEWEYEMFDAAMTRLGIKGVASGVIRRKRA